MAKTFPGFRFSPTEEELVNYYLRNKMNGKDEDVSVIAEIDVFKKEPWALPALSALKTSDPEWFFFCRMDRMYPNGRSQRSSRATESGFWKITGPGRKISSGKDLNATKKTLVFYKGRGTKAKRTNWVMHEYRATADDIDCNGTGQSDFVLCRVFHKEHKGGVKIGPVNSSPTPSNGEAESELTQVSATPILATVQSSLPCCSDRTGNVQPPVESQSNGSVTVAEEKNHFDLDDFIRDSNLLHGPLYSPMPYPDMHFSDFYDLSQSHEAGAFQNELDADPWASCTQDTCSIRSTAGQLYDGYDKSNQHTDAIDNINQLPQNNPGIQGSVKQGNAPRRLRLQRKRQEQPVKTESGGGSFMPEEHELKYTVLEGEKAAGKEVAGGHSATIAVREVKKNTPWFWPSAVIFGVAAVLVMFRRNIFDI